MDALRQWWSSLGSAPRQLTHAERATAWFFSVIAAASRIPALSRTPWDWDEAQLMLGLRHYDVTAHHPHPPGFPLFIGAAKLLTLTGVREFHSLQAVVLIAAMLIVPAALLLGREARLPVSVALTAGLLLAFAPNVWVFGGTAFSDVPSMVLVLFAIGALLYGCRSETMFVIGCVAAGSAIAFRPQNLLIAAVPFVVAAAHVISRRRYAALVLAVLLMAVIVGVSYGAAAVLSHGIARYASTLNAHSAYILKLDSFHNPARPKLSLLFATFFVHPFQAPAVNWSLAIFAVIGIGSAIVRRRVGHWLIAATFIPFCVSAWLFLDYLSVSRFAIGYMPLIAFLAAEGLAMLLSPLRYAMTTAMVIAMVVWTWPILHELRRHDSPPAAAANWIRQHANPQLVTVWAHGSVEPLADALLPDFRRINTGDDGPRADAKPDDIYIQEGLAWQGLVFQRPRKRIASVVRDRYFEVSVVPVGSFVSFAGWYDPERSELFTWRWMGSHAQIFLQPHHRSGVLTLMLYAPFDALPAPPHITIAIDSIPRDRFVPDSATVQREYWIAGEDAATKIDIFTDEVIKPRGDARLLGLRLNELLWKPGAVLR